MAVPVRLSQHLHHYQVSSLLGLVVYVRETSLSSVQKSNEIHLTTYSTNSSYNYNDSRWLYLNLSKAEITTVYNICSKFINRRDELDDLLQVAAIELWRTFEKYKERHIPITFRTSFIRRVVNSIMIQIFVRKTKRDLLYNTDDFEDYLKQLDNESNARD